MMESKPPLSGGYPLEDKLNFLKKFIDLGFQTIHLHYPTEDGSCACNNPDCTSQGKHPPQNGWTEKGQSKFEYAKLAFERNSNYNIGILTGKKSNIIIADFDGPEGIKTYEERSINDPDTLTFKTGKGLHVVYRYDQELADELGGKISNRVRLQNLLVDIRGDNGFIVAPGSLHSTGRRYEILKDVPISKIPEWLKELIRKNQEGKGITSDTVKNPDGRRIPQGQRNDTLHRKCSLWNLKDGIPETRAFELAKEINELYCDPPLPEGEVYNITMSAYDIDPTYEVPVTDFIKYKLVKLEDGTKIDVPTGLHLVRLRDYFLRSETIYKTEQSRGEELLIYNRTNGLFEKKSYIDAAKIVLDILGTEFTELWTNKAKNDFWTITKPMIRTVSLQEFDQEHHLLHCKNCIVDLRTSKTLSFDPKYKFTKSTRVNYTGKNSELWLKTLHKIFCLDKEGYEELAHYYKKFDGYCATGLIQEQIGVIEYSAGGGSGRTLKSEAIDSALGDFAQAISHVNLMMDSRGHNTTYALGEKYLLGVRKITTDETPEGARINTTEWKQRVTDLKVRGRSIYGEERSYPNSGKYIITTNNEIFFGSQGFNIWRRLRVHPYDMVLSEKEIDLTLAYQLSEEKHKEGILTYLVEGAKLYYEEGLKPPAKVTDATADFLAIVDPLYGLLPEAIEESFGKGSFVPVKIIYSYFINIHIKDKNIKNIPNYNTFSKLLSSAITGKYRNVEQVKKKKAKKEGESIQGYEGLKFKENAFEKLTTNEKVTLAVFSPKEPLYHNVEKEIEEQIEEQKFIEKWNGDDIEQG